MREKFLLRSSVVYTQALHHGFLWYEQKVQLRVESALQSTQSHLVAKLSNFTGGVLSLLHSLREGSLGSWVFEKSPLCFFFLQWMCVYVPPSTDIWGSSEALSLAAPLQGAPLISLLMEVSSWMCPAVWRTLSLSSGKMSTFSSKCVFFSPNTPKIGRIKKQKLTQQPQSPGHHWCLQWIWHAPLCSSSYRWAELEKYSFQLQYRWKLSLKEVAVVTQWVAKLCSCTVTSNCKVNRVFMFC